METINIPDWLHDDVLSALQRLVALRLPGGPPEEAILGTAKVWHEALANTSVVWDEALDRKRVGAALGRVISTCDRWPAPKHFFDQLQPRTYAQPALPQKMSAAERQQNRERIKGIVGKFAKQHTI